MSVLGLAGAFDQPYMQRAMIIMAIIAVLGVVVGTHVMLRRLTFLTEAVQHTVLPGIAAAFIAGESLLLGASLAALATVVVFALLDRKDTLDRDSVLALTVTGFLGLGVAIVSTGSGFQRDLTGLLFGKILATDAAQVFETAALAALVLVALAALHKELIFGAFDPAGARASGLRVRAGDLVLNVCVAVTVVASVRTLGTVLVLAFVVTPVIASRMLRGRIVPVMLLASLFALVAGLGGLVLGYELSVSRGTDVPPGALIVVLMTAMLLAAGAVSRLLRATGRAEIS